MAYERHDRLQFRPWLEPLQRDAVAMVAMRKWLASGHDGSDLSRLSDQAVLEQIADFLSRGVAHVHCDAARREQPRGVVPARRTEAAAAPPPRFRAVAPVTSEPEPSTLPGDVDVAVQAATLTAAAANGTPFCPT